MKRKMETLETEGGNTKPPPKRCVPSKRWCFTRNNYDDDEVETLETLFKLHSIEYIFGEEVGEEGTPHLQGYIEAPVKIRPVEKLGLKKYHWERAKGNRMSNMEYCSKDGKFKHSSMLKPRRPLVLIKPRGWQKRVVDVAKADPDDRSIYWYYERIGGVGKTSLCKYLVVTLGAIILGGKAPDIRNGIIDYYNNHGYTPELIVVNFTRSQEEYVSYEGIENIKDMLFYSGKYEGGQICGACPQLICFANFSPDLTKCSKDRWIVEAINTDDT